MATGAALVYNLASLQPWMDPTDARSIQVQLVANLAAVPRGTVLSELAALPGTYRPYGQNTTLTGSTLVGATVFAVAATQGFYVGEVIKIGPNGSAQTDTLTVLTVGVLQITTTAGALYAHSTAEAVTHGDTGAATAKVLLKYDVSTDANKVITYTGLAAAIGAVLAKTLDGVGAYYRGTFNTVDLVGFDAGALASIGASLVQGTLAGGVVNVR